MVQNKSLGWKIFNVCNIVMMALLALSCLYPLWYALCLSLSSKSAANAGMVSFYPVGLSFASYKEIMGDWKFFNSFWISIQRTVLGTAMSLLVMILVGYPLSKTKKEFRSRDVLMWIILFCMVFNGGTIPWYFTMQKYGLIDSIWGLVLAGGLTPENVGRGIALFEPDVVDVSSGVERADGHFGKDEEKIRRFTEEVQKAIYKKN